MVGTTTGFSIGSVESANYWDGPIAEVIVFPNALSTSERQKLEGYLAHKWGLTSNLPVGHPYKTFAPTTITSASIVISQNADPIYATAYSVTYDGNGNATGSPPVDTTEYAQTSQVTVATNSGNLVKENVEFDGWNTAADGSGTNYAESSTLTMPAHNVTLFAKWIVTTPVQSVSATNTATDSYGFGFANGDVIQMKFKFIPNKTVSNIVITMTKNLMTTQAALAITDPMGLYPKSGFIFHPRKYTNGNYKVTAKARDTSTNIYSDLTCVVDESDSETYRFTILDSVPAGKEVVLTCNFRLGVLPTILDYGKPTPSNPVPPGTKTFGIRKRLGELGDGILRVDFTVKEWTYNSATESIMYNRDNPTVTDPENYSVRLKVSRGLEYF
jgi:uncharacterized repeat protein (TIGR02543 family)